MAPPTPDADPLRGLTEGAAVVLDVGEEAIDCRVDALAGGQATLAPRTEADAAYIPSLGRAAELVFAAGASGRRARVAGAVRRGPADGLLAFVAGTDAGVPARRRAARVGIELAVEVTLLDRAGEPAEPPRRLLTTDVSLGGLGVHAEGWTLPEGARLRVVLELPDPPPIEATSRVLREAGGIAGLELTDVVPADRSRLAAFLIAQR